MIFGLNAPKFVAYFGAGDIECTGNASTDNITMVGGSHGLRNGDVITFTSVGGDLPSPLDIAVNYYVVEATITTFKVSLTKGGTAINLTNAGTGTHYYQPERTINLDYVVVVKDEPENENIIHQAPLTGERGIVHYGQHWEFEVRINLWKYSSPRSKYNEVLHFLSGQHNLALFRHRDGDELRDSDGNTVDFRIISARPSYLTTVDYQDILTVRFISTKYVDLTDASAAAEIQLSDLMMGGMIE